MRVEVVLGEKQIVRAGLDRHVHAARASFRCLRDAAAGADVHDVKLRAGLSGEIDGARDRLDLGLDRARREKIAARVDPVMPRGSRRVISSLSAWTATGRPSRAASRIPSRSVLSSAYGNSARPESHMNALKPTTPRSAIAGHLIDRARDEPAPQPEIGDRRRFERRALAHRRPLRVTVHGVELSGMSKNSVPPPAASAWLPVSAPSHSVRPGSLK